MASRKVEPTETDLLDELARDFAAAHPVLQPGDVTVAAFAERQGLTSQNAQRYLDRLAKDGKLTRHYVKGPAGRWCWAYRKPE